MPIMIWAAAGAAAMYCMDPTHGRERREKFRGRLNGILGENSSVLDSLDSRVGGLTEKVSSFTGMFGGSGGASNSAGSAGDSGSSGAMGGSMDGGRESGAAVKEPAWAAGIGSGVTGADYRGTDTPTAAEMQDPGAHDRGGWLTLDEAAQQFNMGRAEIQAALREGRISGRRVAGEGIAPENAPADTVVPEGAIGPDLGPQDDWLVQPDQMERLVQEKASA